MSNIDNIDIDISLLRLLDALLCDRNVTRAAQRLRITQSAASHGLGRLRRAFGDPLFVRGGSGVVPTERALALGSEVREVLFRIEALVRGSGPFDARTLVRTFTLIGTDYVETMLLPALLRRVSKAAPGIGLVNRPTGGDPGFDLESGAVDLAVGVFYDVSARLVQRKLLDEQFICMLRRGHPALRRKFTATAYAGLPHVLVSPSGSAGGVVDRVLAMQGLERRVAIRTATFIAAPRIVSQTDCVATLPERLASVMAKGRSLVLVPPPVRVPGFTLSMLFHERSRSDPGHTWLRNQLADAAAALIASR